MSHNIRPIKTATVSLRKGGDKEVDRKERERCRYKKTEGEKREKIEIDQKIEQRHENCIIFICLIKNRDKLHMLKCIAF